MTDELSDELCQEIGRVVIKHAFLESVLQHIIYDLVDVDDAIGRLALRDPRTSDKLKLIEELCQYKQIALDTQMLKLLRSDLPKLASLRDTLAHGAFYEDPEHDRILIRDVRGSWQPPGMVKGKVSKRMHPSGPYIESEAVSDIADVIEVVIQTCRHLRASVREQLPEQHE